MPLRYFDREGRNGRVPASARCLDQRDAMPRVLWDFAERGCGATGVARFAACGRASRALEAATRGTTRDVGIYVRQAIETEAALFARGAAHVMTLYQPPKQLGNLRFWNI